MASATALNATAIRRRRIGLTLGPLAALVVYLLVPESARLAETIEPMSQAGRAVTAVAALMAVLWVTEALPVSVTALLPIVLFPLLTGGRITPAAATAPYAHELIFLFLGGFVLAQAMQKWGLHHRIALNTIRVVGTKPASLVGGFMVASALLSMWVSNTATVVMMLPIALSVTGLVRADADTGPDVTDGGQAESARFAVCLLLGTAYASSIGGIGTLIGTPPNALLAAYLSDEFGIQISFVRWLGVGLPLVAIFLPLTWLMLTRVMFPIRLREIPGGRLLIRRRLDELGRASRAERLVLVVFVVTAACWITRPLMLRLVHAVSHGGSNGAAISDAGIAIAAAVALFLIPAGGKRGVYLMTWRDAAKLPWGILVLFGGGLSLATALRETGVTEYIGQLVSSMPEPPPMLLMIAVTTTVVFLTELTSNTATAAAFLPILGAVAVGLGRSPLMLTVPAAIAASFAFMMPIATPPNAIVFSSGQVTVPQMCKAGLWLNLLGVACITALMYLIAGHVLGFSIS